MVKALIIHCPVKGCGWESRPELKDDNGDWSLDQYMTHVAREHRPKPWFTVIELTDETV